MVSNEFWSYFAKRAGSMAQKRRIIASGATFFPREQALIAQFSSQKVCHSTLNFSNLMFLQCTQRKLSEKSDFKKKFAYRSIHTHKYLYVLTGNSTMSIISRFAQTAENVKQLPEALFSRIILGFKVVFFLIS